MEFSYVIEQKDNVNIISFSGNLNDKNQTLKLMEEVEELINNGLNKFVLCMEDFKYITSTGLNVLITILTKARKSNGEVVISKVPQKINELLLITKLNTVFIVTETNEEAIQKLK